jgi:hypothetical protein
MSMEGPVPPAAERALRSVRLPAISRDRVNEGTGNFDGLQKTDEEPREIAGTLVDGWDRRPEKPWET